MAEERFDVIVVGAGFGGSACAGLLAKRGLEVLLLEKNAKAGGKAMAFSKSGFVYTPWVVITAPIQDNAFERVLKELGMEDRVELVTPDASGGAIFKNSQGKYVPMPPVPTDSPPDPNMLFDWLEVPEEQRDAALTAMAEITLMPPDQIDEHDDISFAEFLTRYDLPAPVYGYLVGSIHDACFVCPVDVVAASEAIRVLQMVFLRSGGLFAKGGIGRVAETYAAAVEENGGKYVTKARVQKILVENGAVTGVATDDGTFHAPIVVSNVGIQPTVLKLVGEEHFDERYLTYVRTLVPSWGLPGVRYFLDEKVIQQPFGTIFSTESYWTVEKFKRAADGDMPEHIAVLYEVPSNYDENAAPEGKQIVLASVWGPADGRATDEHMKPWWQKCDEIMFQAFPDLPKHIERKEYYSVRDVSKLTRDCVLPNQGGECIGLGQVVGQGGRKKPSVSAPIRGLFFVGCDAGGYGVGTQQATESGLNVANEVERRAKEA
ncbi:MAG: NAD(P)/FAD-dependent oxidoreductase [Deltaproteobacteria bacterium]|nr:NAD(P)/FAD-dependent oxidoreductase [Deltaproteobacteria bacterium]